MQKLYYSFLVLVIIITIFISSFSSQEGKIILTNSKEYFWPTPLYHQITSSFGYRQSPIAGASTYHQGIDIAAKEGSGVSVIADGTVIFAGFQKNTGNLIIVKHPNELKSYYEHLGEDFYVKEGDLVKKGQVIGRVGPVFLSTGERNGVTTGVHLHFGVNQKGQYFDPLELFESN